MSQTASAFLASLITLGGAILIVVFVQLVLTPLVRARKTIGAHRKEIEGLRRERDTAGNEADELREQRNSARRERDEALSELSGVRTKIPPSYTQPCRAARRSK